MIRVQPTDAMPSMNSRQRLAAMVGGQSQYSGALARNREPPDEIGIRSRASGRRRLVPNPPLPVRGGALYGQYVGNRQPREPAQGWRKGLASVFDERSLRLLPCGGSFALRGCCS